MRTPRPRPGVRSTGTARDPRYTRRGGKIGAPRQNAQTGGMIIRRGRLFHIKGGTSVLKKRQSVAQFPSSLTIPQILQINTPYCGVCTVCCYFYRTILLDKALVAITKRLENGITLNWSTPCARLLTLKATKTPNHECIGVIEPIGTNRAIPQGICPICVSVYVFVTIG